MTGRGAVQQARARWVALGLVAAVGLCYARVLGHGYVDWDDDLYVYENARVLAGIGLDGLVWAFRTFHTSNWHPLTWLSHQLDVALFGPGPLGPHLVNIVLHAANSVLVFAFFRRTTGALWPAAAVAALFALHPLRVESVAWISERKDLLCALFGLLSLHAYVRYSAERSARRYAVVFALLALGLLAKPMLVTLPLALLLLDHWPLRRTAREPLRALVLEKLPLLALSAASSAMSLVAARSTDTLAALDGISLAQRLATAAVAYVTYLAETLWPLGLACLYPHPALGPGADALPALGAGAAVLLAAISAAVVWLRRARPYLLVGWLWYLGTLVPVIGLVQVGVQGHADRYTYLPLIGVYAMAAYAAWELVRESRERLVAASAAGGLALALLGAATFVQAGTWRDTRTLFEHAISTVGDHAVLLSNLGNLAFEEGDSREAERLYRAALASSPRYAKAHYNLANMLLGRNRLDEAIAHFETALAEKPGYARAHNNLGNAYFRKGLLESAAQNYRRALEFDPLLVQAHNNLGSALSRQGKLLEAIEAYEGAVALDPEWAQARVNLGNTYARLGRLDAARNQLERALALRPREPGTYTALARVLTRQGLLEEAARRYEQAIALDPRNRNTRERLERLRARMDEGD